MKQLAIIILLAFVAIGVFGYAGFAAEHNSAFMACVNTLTGGQMNCMSQIEMGLLHVRIYQSFSQALLISFVLLFAAASVAISGLVARALTFEKVYEITPQASRRNPAWQVLHLESNPLL